MYTPEELSALARHYLNVNMNVQDSYTLALIETLAQQLEVELGKRKRYKKP